MEIYLYGLYMKKESKKMGLWVEGQANNETVGEGKFARLVGYLCAQLQT